MDVREKSSNEKRLIDANRALEIVHDQRIAHPNAYHLTNYATLILREAPTVDAVEVVRCRECKHHRDKNEQERQYLVEDILICTSPDATDDCWNAVWPDHFCSYGERKEGAD